jgi:cytochrome P450
LSKAFNSRLIEARQPRIQALVDQLLDEVVANGRMDIIHDLAYPLPATIIAEIIGAPAEDIDLFRQWAIGINRLFESGGRVTPASVKAAQDSLLEMRVYIGRLIGKRRQEPGDDILSHLVAAEQQADRLSVAELVSTAVTLFVAGHETTTHLTGNGMLALLRQPDQVQKLKENPALITGAVEEMLRYDTAVQRGWRIAAEDIEIDGCRIKKGELVLPMLGAANRDPAEFPEPDRFDICRQDNKHLGFGYGIHFCLGAPLARLEAPIAINTLLRRFPNLQLETKALSWRQDIALRGLIELPVVF